MSCLSIIIVTVCFVFVLGSAGNTSGAGAGHSVSASPDASMGVGAGIVASVVASVGTARSSALLLVPRRTQASGGMRGAHHCTAHGVPDLYALRGIGGCGQAPR